MPTRRAFLRLPLLAAPAVAGCTAALNALAPTDALDRRRDVRYADLPRNLLDVYLPRSAPNPRPVIVFFYGGSWQSGSKAKYLFVAEALTSRGFAVVIPDYRVYPEVRFPAFVEDGARAVAWTRANLGALGGDPDRLYVMGHSAGAHIAALLALDARYLAAAGTSPSRLAGLIGLAGPYDFEPKPGSTLHRVLVPDGAANTSRPIAYATAAAPRAFLATGTDDRTVGPFHTERLAARLRALGVPVTERRYPGVDHYTIVGYLAAPLRADEPMLDDLARFVREA